MFSIDDTIVAVATAPGRAGLGVVRLSGGQAASIACDLMRRATPLEPRHATFGRVWWPGVGERTDEVVDQVVATYFPAPHSYTGQDVVELGLHGNPVVLARVLDAATRGGARLAERGEFTLRAYLLGRIDLVQAEAVHDLVEAATGGQARTACDQLEGTLTTAIGAIERRLFNLIVGLEASLDFPEEPYHFVDVATLAHDLAGIESSLVDLVASGRRGRVVREGCLVAILGRTNVGKSSLFNILYGSDRAIVTSQPGTTRDLLAERCDIDGVPVTFVDTAGLRETDDEVEREGVSRARRVIEQADGLLLVFDRSVAIEADDLALLDATAGRPRVLVANKTDLPAAWCPADRADAPSWVEVSAVTGHGVDALRVQMVRALGACDLPRDGVLVTNVRHLRLLEVALEAVSRARVAATDGVSEEFVLADLHEAGERLQEVTGRRASDEILREIFARFCIGK